MDSKRLRYVLAGVLIGVCLSVACRSVPVRVETELSSEADFSSYSSFTRTVLRSSDPGDTDPDAEVERLLVSELDSLLRAKGYEKSASDEADLVVRLLVREETDTRIVNAGDPDADYHRPKRFARGKLEITVFEQAEDLQVWRGVGRTDVAISGALIVADPEDALLESLRKVLSKFPDSSAAGS